MMKRFSREEVASFWCVLGTYLSILTAALWLNGFVELWQTLILFFQGRPEMLVREDASLLKAIPLAAALLVIDIPVSMLVAYIVHKLPKLHLGSLTRGIFPKLRAWLSRSVSLNSPDTGARVFAIYFGVIFLEEVFARWLFLGVLYPGLSLIPYPPWYPIFFYLLFLLGNGLWALAHLGNYERRWGRSVLWVAPQFVGGIGLTIVYWRYGFWAALLTHFAYDTMLWCIEKRQNFDALDRLHLILSAVYAGLAYLMLDHQPSEILRWVEQPQEFKMEGWGAWEFTKLALYFYGLSGLIFGLLLYDHSGSEQHSSTKAAVGGGCGAVLGCYVVFWILQGIAGSVAITILIYALLKILQARDTSLNAMCRTFWTSVPLAAIIISGIQILPLWGAMLFLFLTELSLLPLNLLEHVAREK